jgi:Protein of unknown function (DUF3750)
MSSETIAGEGTFQQKCAAASALRSASTVQLRYATLPHPLRPIAVHYWFAVCEATSGRWHRWEVWQTKNAGGQSRGHVRCDLRHPDCGVGGGAYRLAAAWDGHAAQAICAVLTRAHDYPYWNRYRPWPGPNSNTFAAWVLREAGLSYAFDPRAIGKDYMGLLGMHRSSRPTYAQVETPLLGFRISPQEGVEVHFLGLTCGLRWSPLAVDTPLGRVSLRRVLCRRRRPGDLA